MEPVMLVLTNLPDREAARKLAEGLVGAHTGSSLAHWRINAKSLYTKDL